MNMADTAVTMKKPKKIKYRNKASFFEQLANQKYLQGMALRGMLWMLVFNYIPMGGIVIAFKKFKITRTIAEAPWVGLKYFKEFFMDDNFVNIMQNTLGISLLKLFIG